MAHTTNRTATTRRGRRVTAAAAAGALALLLTACGGQGGTDGSGSTADGTGSTQGQSPVQLVAAAAKNSSGKSAKISIDVKTDAAGMSIPVTGTGTMDSAKGAMQLEISTEVPGMGALKLKQVLVDGTLYMSGFPGAGDKWAKISTEELGALGGTGAGAVTDPADQLQMLTKVSDDVKAAGSAQVNGVKTTKYTGTIDLKKAAAASGQKAADAEKLAKQYEAMGLAAIPFEFYVDDAGLPARMVTTVNGQGQGQKITAVSTIDFSDWGTPVTVTAPKGAVPLQELMGGAAGAQQG